MKVPEKIYTIPVHDALLQTEECPFCYLYRTREEELLKYYLGPSLMQPDIRVETNRVGFCPEHWHCLYERKENTLGLALILHTHTRHRAELHLKLLSKIANLEPNSDAAPRRLRRSLGRRDSEVATVAAEITADNENCLICQRIEETMRRYAQVMLWQYVNEPHFPQMLAESHDICLRHFPWFLTVIDSDLRNNEARTALISQLAQRQMSILAKLDVDLEWFTKKFDYRNRNEPWYDSEDAVERAVDYYGGKRYQE
ncbi:MAG: hypothetical protein GX900_04980 [Clostridiaceae bacterium]|nr:hypothetical protein [Clostridiaceae bacterium]